MTVATPDTLRSLPTHNVLFVCITTVQVLGRPFSLELSDNPYTLHQPAAGLNLYRAECTQVGCLPVGNDF